MTAQAKMSRRLMEEAIAQRARCFLCLPEHLTGVRELTCSIREASSRGLILESLGKAATGPHWIGIQVTGYFRVVIREQGPENNFYTFDSRIRTVTPAPGGQARLCLAEPDAFVFGQRRRSLRVIPELPHLHKAFLWRYDKTEGFSLDAPAFKSSDFQAGLAQLADISAGGIRLRLRPMLLRERGVEMDTGQRLVVHLELNEPRVAGDHEFWMVARICYTQKDPVTRDVTCGMEFLASGSLDPKAGKIRWQPVQDHVIPELADIFFLWHLDQHRGKLL